MEGFGGDLALIGSSTVEPQFSPGPPAPAVVSCRGWHSLHAQSKSPACVSNRRICDKRREEGNHMKSITIQAD